MEPLQEEIEALRLRFPGLATTKLPSGATLVQIPEMPLPNGWSKTKSNILFVAPQGYPFAAPDCFWADQDLRLANNGMPQNTQITPIPETSDMRVWFSWHMAHPWNPNRDSLTTWVSVILQRLNRLV